MRERAEQRAFMLTLPPNQGTDNSPLPPLRGGGGLGRGRSPLEFFPHSLTPSFPAKQ